MPAARHRRSRPRHALSDEPEALNQTRRRFFGNERRWAAQEQLLRAVIGSRKTVFISVDWTKNRDWPALGQLKMTKADRLERMLFVAALVHFLARFQHNFTELLRDCCSECE